MFSNEKSKIKLFIINNFICLSALSFIFGCEVVNNNNTSVADKNEMKSMLRTYNVLVRLQTREEYGRAEVEMDSLAYRLDVFCKSHKISRSTVLESTSVKPMLNDDDFIIFVFNEYSCSMSGVMFIFSGGTFVKDVRPFSAMQ